MVASSAFNLLKPRLRVGYAQVILHARPTVALGRTMCIRPDAAVGPMRDARPLSLLPLYPMESSVVTVGSGPRAPGGVGAPCPTRLRQPAGGGASRQRAARRDPVRSVRGRQTDGRRNRRAAS